MCSAILLMTARAGARTLQPNPPFEAETHEGEAAMPYCLIAENPAETAEHSDRVAEHLRTTGPIPPEGQLLLISGAAESGWRNVSVWDSLESQQRFFEGRLKAAVDYAGCPMESAKIAVFEVHTLMAGDLMGTPQPA